MVLFNHSTRELTAKIVYYGPGLCGKTTNLRLLHERLEKGSAGRLLSLATAQDRTIYFDLLPVELGNIKGYTVRFQLCTVPGQVFYNETRKLVLRGVDGLVFVVDSQPGMLSHDLESFQNLRENLREAGLSIEALPLVVQYNKRDLQGVLSIDDLQTSLGFQSYPYTEAVASTGRGVVETFKLVSKLTFVDLLRRLQKSGNLPEPESGATADPGEETLVGLRKVFKPTFTPEPEAPAMPPPIPSIPKIPLERMEQTESPFEMSGNWPAGPEGDVFGEAVAAQAFHDAPRPNAPISAPTVPISSPIALPPIAGISMPVANVELPPPARGMPAALLLTPPPSGAAPVLPATAHDEGGGDEAFVTRELVSLKAPTAPPSPPAPPAPSPASASHAGPAWDGVRRELAALADKVDSLANDTTRSTTLAAFEASLAEQGTRLETLERAHEAAEAARSASLEKAVDSVRISVAGEMRGLERTLRADLDSLREHVTGVRHELTSTLPTRDDLEAAREEARKAADAAAAALAATTGPRSGEEGLAALRSDLEARDMAARGDFESLRSTVADLAAAVEALKLDVAGLRDDSGRRAADAGKALADLAKAVEASREAATRGYEDARSAARGDVATLADTVARADSERRGGHDALASRVVVLDAAVSRLDAALDEERRRGEERLGAAERRMRTLADALRSALQNLGE